MTRDESIGFVMTPEVAEIYFTRIMEAEKAMGPLSEPERIVILKSLAQSISLDELLHMIAGKRVLRVKGKDEKEV